MKILLFSRYDALGPSSRMRSFQYVDYLERHGAIITIRPLSDERFLKRMFAKEPRDFVGIAKSYGARILQLTRSGTFDLVWIEKELFPNLPPWFEILLGKSGIPYLVDYDDATFHQYDQHPRPLVRRVLGRKIDTVMRHATLVVAGNAYLAARARAAGARWIEQLPTVIDLDRYPATPARPDDAGDFRVGWIGSPTTSPFLSLVEAPLRRLCDAGASRLVTIGARDLDLSGIPIEQRSWSEASEVGDLQSLDVGIMPLVDAPFERGKCGYKLIQYMACGLPVVASPVGVNREIVEHGVNGFLASTEAEWLDALTRLRASPDLRRSMGAAGRARVEQHYCLQVTAPRLYALAAETALRRHRQAGRTE